MLLLFSWLHFLANWLVCYTGHIFLAMKKVEELRTAGLTWKMWNRNHVLFWACSVLKISRLSEGIIFPLSSSVFVCLFLARCKDVPLQAIFGITHRRSISLNSMYCFGIYYIFCPRNILQSFLSWSLHVKQFARFPCDTWYKRNN